MRTFYIFKIKNEYVTLTKNNPYHLFKFLSCIYDMDVNNISEGIKLFNSITTNFEEKEIDINLFKKNCENYFYTKYRNIHQLNNFYKKESSKLIIHKKFLLLESTAIYPSFMKDLLKYKNLFFCDFKNKDYFWLEELFVT